MTPLNKSTYSFHFNNLVFLGAWVIDSENRFIVYLYSLYKLVVIALELYAIYGLFLDFFHWLGDLKKMSWNLCVTTMLVTMVLKSNHLYHRCKLVNDLRMKLHRDAELRKASEDVHINNLAMKELITMRIIFYVAGALFIPFWLFTRFFVHRELPVPFQVPDHVDLSDDHEFKVVFIGLGFAGLFGLVLAVETELAMFGILIQISREYQVLLEDIPKLNELYESDVPQKVPRKNSGDPGVEVNPWLRQARTKMQLKKLSYRLQELIEYTEVFEYCYHAAFLEEFFGLCAVSLAVSFQSTLGNLDVRGAFVYQMGYLSIIIIDMFTICMYATRIHSQCVQVGDAAYSTFWYRMGPEIRRDIALLILRTQHPPKITMGKLLELNLKFFIMRMGNMYSWLAMLRQIEFKILSNNSQET